MKFWLWIKNLYREIQQERRDRNGIWMDKEI